MYGAGKNKLSEILEVSPDQEPFLNFKILIINIIINFKVKLRILEKTVSLTMNTPQQPLLIVPTRSTF